MKISEVFSSSRKIFIAYITGGDPDLKATKEYLKVLQESGADIIELGVPFSDPVADGPTIQRATERALKKKTTLEKLLKLVADLRKSKSFTVPIVLFTYFNPVYRMGIEKFAKEAAKAGVNGVLVVDLPPEEGEEFSKIISSVGLETIFLASPTTSDERLELIQEASTGFVYYVSRLGVTGVQKTVSETLGDEIIKLRKFIKKPIAIGFGISTPKQAKSVAQFGDGVVVGSALVDIIEKHPNTKTAKTKLSQFTKGIIKAIGSHGPCIS